MGVEAAGHAGENSHLVCWFNMNNFFFFALDSNLCKVFVSHSFEFCVVSGQHSDDWINDCYDFRGPSSSEHGTNVL